jgi:hypothetical protein
LSQSDYLQADSSSSSSSDSSDNDKIIRRTPWLSNISDLKVLARKIVDRDFKKSKKIELKRISLE